MEDAADGTRTGDAQSSWVLDCVSFLEYKSCGSLLPWIYSHAPRVCAGASAFRGRITTCKWTNNINRLFRKKKYWVKNGCKGHFIKCGGKSAFTRFCSCADRLLAGHIKVSHKCLYFPEDASELENSFQVSSVVPWFMSSNCRQWSNNNNN